MSQDRERLTLKEEKDEQLGKHYRKIHDAVETLQRRHQMSEAARHAPEVKSKTWRRATGSVNLETHKLLRKVEVPKVVVQRHLNPPFTIEGLEVMKAYHKKYSAISPYGMTEVEETLFSELTLSEED